MPESRPEDDAVEPASTPQEPTAEEDEPEFVNRAARRAKGKSAGQPAVFAKGKAPVGRGAVQSPRQYGARRSG